MNSRQAAPLHSAAGKCYAPVSYLVGREKVREYARAVGEVNPLYLDPEAARRAGHADVVAPPMFVVVYSREAFDIAAKDPEVGLDYDRAVHGSQDFRWGQLVVAGDLITTEVLVARIEERNGLGFYVFASHSANQKGEAVCSGEWTIVVRRPEANRAPR